MTIETTNTTPFAGWGHGALGVLIFSASLPATRLAVAEFTPLFLTATRAVIAAALGAACLAAMRGTRPQGTDLRSLMIVALGVVLGFPLLTALALQSVTAAHSVVFIGLLPLSTALFGVIRGGEHPHPAFWLFAGTGALIVAAFALSEGTGETGRGDALMLAGVLVCGLGYAEGATLSRRLGGWQVISWALLLSLPVMVPLMAFTWPETLHGISASAWAGLGYVSAFSMMLGFVFWYRGLALGGIAGVGQLQLLQPFLGLLLAALLLDDAIHPSMIASALAVLACVLLARRFSQPKLQRS